MQNRKPGTEPWHRTHNACTVHEYMMDPEYDEFFSTVDPSNQASVKSIIDVGFSRWDPPDPDLMALKQGLAAKAGLGTTYQPAYYRLPKSALVDRAGALMNRYQKPKVVRKSRTKPGHSEAIDIELRVEPVLNHLALVQTMANGNLAIH